MAKATVHQWINKYTAPIGSGVVISTGRPGETIAKAITEIQTVISEMQGADKDDPATVVEKKVADVAKAVEDLASGTATAVENTPAASIIDIRFDAASGQFQKKIKGGEWQMIEGGQGTKCP